MLKGRKQKYNERWGVAEMKSNIPILRSTPVASRLLQLAAEIRREHRTRQPTTEQGE